MPIILSDNKKNVKTIGVGKLSIKNAGMSLILIIKVFSKTATCGQ